jgi:hypothetical protein
VQHTADARSLISKGKSLKRCMQIQLVLYSTV